MRGDTVFRPAPEDSPCPLSARLATMALDTLKTRPLVPSFGGALYPTNLISTMQMLLGWLPGDAKVAVRQAEEGVPCGRRPHVARDCGPVGPR